MAIKIAGQVVHEALTACRRHFIYAGLFSGLINLLYLAPSIFMLQVYDRVVPTQGGATLFLLLVVLAFALAVLAVMDLARMRLLQLASVRLEKLAAGPLTTQILGTERVAPATRAQALRDFDTVRGTLAGPAIVALFDAPWAPIFIAVSFLLHPWLGVLSLVSAMILVMMAWLGERATQSGIRAATARHSEVARLQDFSLHAAEVARALGMRSAVVARQLAQRAELVAIQASVSRRSAEFLAATKFMRLLLQSVALAVGAWLAINQQISTGAIFAAALILGRALQPIEQILAGLKNVLSARSAYENLKAFGEAAEFDPHRTQLPSPAGRLAVEGVTVLDATGSRRLLDGVSFGAVPGELIAVVGPSGAGKSTLLRALAGAIEVNAGEVRIDGALHSDWDSDRLGRHIGYMPQEPTLFPATIHANICRLATYLGEDCDRTDRKVIEAATLAGAHETILRTAKAYETDLGGREGGLSAGQRQLIALARALYDEPKLMLLDEPNAHLDGEAEAWLVQAFVELKKRGTTILVSTHRTGILAVADKILVLRDGAVQAFGPRDAIIRGAGAPTPIAAPQQREEATSNRAAA